MDKLGGREPERRFSRALPEHGIFSTQTNPLLAAIPTGTQHIFQAFLQEQKIAGSLLYLTACR